MPAPTVDDVRDYLGVGPSWSDDEVARALSAEEAAQAAVCTIPEDEWPADLTEALLRRVHVNLANRALPLGVAASMSEAYVATSRVGGLDREVRRLEAPYRRLALA